MNKPRVDITETGGARWTMGKLVMEALGKGLEQNQFLSEFNDAAGHGSEDDVLRAPSNWAVLIFEGEEICVTVEEEDMAKKKSTESEALVIPEDTEKLGVEATEYLAEVEALDIDVIGYENVVGLLADVKDIFTRIEAKRKDLGKGARETVSKINAEFKPATDAYIAAEKILKNKIVEYRTDINSIRTRMFEAGEDPIEPVPEVAGVRVSEKLVIISIDEDVLPKKFFTRAPNQDMILASVKEGMKVKGVVTEVTEILAIEHKKVKR